MSLSLQISIYSCINVMVANDLKVGVMVCMQEALYDDWRHHKGSIRSVFSCFIQFVSSSEVWEEGPPSLDFV